MKYKREKDKHELEIISALEIIKRECGKREECSGCSVKENMNNKTLGSCPAYDIPSEWMNNI